MIARIWHGWTTLENADAYEAHLRGEVLPGIERRAEGFRASTCSGATATRSSS